MDKETKGPPPFSTLDDLDADGARALVRVDLNVPMDDGAVADATRIERVAPTIAELAEAGGRVVVMSHFGRPRGKTVPGLSLAPLAAPLSRALGGREVAFAGDCVGAEAAEVVGGLDAGGVALLENLRFHRGEEHNDPAFAAALANLGDVYVNDAFAVAHRAHASTVGVARLLPSYAGRLMQAELEALDAALDNPARPLAAIIGGAKISTKIGIVGRLAGHVDLLVIGGAMANTFLLAEGSPVGKSLVERDAAALAGAIVDHARESGCELMLPEDVVTTTRFEAGAPQSVVPVAEVADDAMILDIGPATAARIVARLAEMKTVVWNGPLGAFELAGFDSGTNTVARAVASLTRAGLISVAGGGDTLAALAHAGASDGFTYVSTAGGAFLEWLEGKELPGVAALGR